MRKKVNVIVILLLAMCLLTLVACQPGRDANGLIKLKTPKNLALSGSALSWDEVEHAERYYISVEGEEKAETTSTTYDLSTIVTGYGDFSVAVRAFGDGETYGTSDVSESIVYHKGNSLDTPIVTVDKNAKTASWNSVENAADYSVAVYNGKDELVNQMDTTQPSYSFADKTDGDGKDVFENFDKYRITVVARPAQDNDKYSNSLMGSAYYFHSTTLSVPEFSSLNSSRIQWGTITNAKSYTLKLTYRGSDGEVEEKQVDTTGTSYQRSNFNYDKVGDYYFTVKANGDNEVYYDSDWCAESETYKVTKLQGVDAQDVNFVYNSDGKARLTWSIDANTTANQFYLSLKGLMPDGKSKLENSETSMTVSCNLVYVTGVIYDLYQYTNSEKSEVEKIEGKIVVYNMDGDLMVRYNNVPYKVKNNLGDEIRYASYIKSDGVDIVYHEGNFIYRQNVPIAGGEKADQSTGEEEELFGADGNRLYYFEEDSSDENIEKTVEFNDDHEAVKYVFAIDLDTIFIKEETQTPDEGDPTTTYEYKIKDSSYYGILYNISVSAGHSSNSYVSSSDAATVGRYLSYKIPKLNDEGVYEINDAGEYAYIVLKNYIDSQNGVSTQNKYKIMNNINFNGYEVTQIATLKDSINGNFKTLSNMVVGNSQLTEDGVVEIDEVVDGKAVKKYSMFLNVDNTADISDAFFMGIGFVGYEKEDVEDSVREIYVAPIAINNNGRLDRLFVQSDEIKADSAYLAGIVINNYGGIYNSQVYAELSGRIVAGIAINNKSLASDAPAAIYDSGFYGSIDASEGEFIQSELTYIAGAGLVVENNNGSGLAWINNSEAIGNVKATAANLQALYAGGLVAINNGSINKSFSGEYTRYNVSNRKEVVANGNNAYAGGLVALNGSGGQIADSYSTDRVTANEYVGGLVGRNKGSIQSSYAIGGTSRGGINNGAFAGSNEGTITNSAAYSSDAWAQEADYFTLIKQESQLGNMINVLYPDTDRQMTLTEKEGFRYPILTNRTYTKDYVVEMSPKQIPEVDGIAVINGEVKDLSIVEEDICGDRSTRGNKVVIVLNYKEPTSGGNYIKLIYGKVR